MRLEETIAFYLLMGAGVSLATLLTSERRTSVERGFLALTAALFWPLYVPLLLSRPASAPEPANEPTVPCDEMAAAIAQVNAELDWALSSLDGWAENVLESEQGRLGELRAALAAHAERIRAMDALLAGSQTAEVARSIPGLTPVGESGERWRQSETARSQNVARLAAVRRQSHADLMATLAWIRELVSMIHLAKFTGEPASRAEELVAQLAAAVEGISAVAAGHGTDTPEAGDDSLRAAKPPSGSNNVPVPSNLSRSSQTWVSSNAPAT